MPDRAIHPPSESAAPDGADTTDDAEDVAEAERAAASRALPLIDLTSLGDDDDERVVERLCARAVTPHGPVAAVCVWSRFVATAVAALDGTGLPVAGVANFPDGSTDVDRALADAAEIVESGGREVDVVLPWRALAAGDPEPGRRLVQAVRAAIGDDVVLKVILESGELADPALIRAAADLSLDGGADFLKTSTGKSPTSATLPAAQVMLDALADTGGQQGLKVSGGLRAVSDVVPYLALADRLMGDGWAEPGRFRIGASALLDDVLRALDRGPSG